MKNAADVMSKDVVYIEPTASVAQAAALMQQKHFHSLVVERATPVDAYGIITDTDVVQKVVSRGKDPARTLVREVMSCPIITVPPDCQLQDIAALMTRAHVNHLPVFDGRKIVGMVSSTDIFNVR